MPIFKRVVNITERDDGSFEVTDNYGPHRGSTFDIDGSMTLEEFFFHRLNLRPGDRIETNFLDAENPHARIGKPRRARPGLRTGRPPIKKVGDEG